ncbi:MAG: hypothetical protein KKI09_09000 [Spirochaetes bacterium]|nr:hypothetical protein [Spirochaetota bacterium]MBU0955550.1 hypothetical protein [Spirochaetota bacterium]
MIRVKTSLLAVLVVAGIFGGIMIAKAVGYWATESTKEPVKFKTGEFAGMPNPADIRGSYTWLDIERVFALPAADAAAAFSSAKHSFAPADRVNLLEELYVPVLPEDIEIGTGSVRLFTALYTGLPFEAEVGTLLPPGAIQYLVSEKGLNRADLAAFEVPAEFKTALAGANLSEEAAETPEEAGGKVDTAAEAAETGSAETAAEEEHTPTPAGEGSGIGTGTGTGTAMTVVGKTTFYDLYQWGLTKEQVQAAIGFEPGANTTSVRDAATAAGVEFSVAKTALQALLDTLKP